MTGKRGQVSAALLVHKVVQAAGGRMAVCVTNDSVRRPFSVSKIDTVIDIHDDLDTAIQSMRSR